MRMTGFTRSSIILITYKLLDLNIWNLQNHYGHCLEQGIQKKIYIRHYKIINKSMTTTNTEGAEWEKEYRELMKVHQTNMQVVEMLDSPQVEIRMPFLEDWLWKTITHQRQQAVAEFAREVMKEIDRLEKEVIPTHAEENGYGCALDDIQTLLEKRNIKNLWLPTMIYLLALEDSLMP